MKSKSKHGARPTKLNGQFWRHFSQTVWEKKAAVYEDIESPLRQIDQSRIFQMLVAYSDRCRKQKQAGGFKLFLDGERQYDLDTLQFLPDGKDGSLLGYHRRMEALFPDYCLVCDELLQVSLESWGLLVDFTGQLYQQIGFPNRFSELGLYLGNYQKTPFGVHVDGCGVFSFPAVGTKKFRLWSPEYIKKNPELIEAHEYEEFKKQSQVLTVQPGGMSYWPSKAWHIAESDGSFSATWSLGVWVDRPHRDQVVDTIKSVFEKALGPAMEQKTVAFQSLHEKSGQMGSMPKLYQESAAVLQKMTADQIHDLFQAAWMELTSKQGLKNLPPQEKKRKLSKRDVIQNRLPSPVLWSKSKAQKQIRYAFGGQVFHHDSSAQLQKLIQDLNAGESCNIGDYLKSSKAAKDLLLLQNLYDAGAFATLK